MIKVKRKKKNKPNPKVIIDGYILCRNKRVNICSYCARTSGCNHGRHLSTSAGYWYDKKKEYKWKIMGSYRLTLWIRKQNNMLHT
jgi:hypothetical protein